MNLAHFLIVAATVIILLVLVAYAQLWRRLTRAALEQARTKTLLSERMRQSEDLRTLIREQEQKLHDLQQAVSEKDMALASLQMKIRAGQEAYEEKISLLQEMREEMKKDFELLSTQILEDKTKRFSSSNQDFMSRLSSELGGKIAEFRERIEKTYDSETRDRVGLRQEILQLKELNQKITQEAHNLTQALKGNNKQVGNWGEMILESILETSGLRSEKEFSVQPPLRDGEGSLLRPDVVVHLPAERDIIIDSKVSLLAYSQFCEIQANGEGDGLRALNQHVQSLKAHIQSLSRKSYSDSKEVNSLDFVIMFIPIEPAYLAAIATDEDLFAYGLRHGVVLSGPNTLLIILRLVKQLWRSQEHGEITQDMAKLATQIYDKFASLLAKLEKLGWSLEKSQKYYKDVKNHLSSGKTNLLSNVEELRKLGISPKKEIPPNYRTLITD